MYTKVSTALTALTALVALAASAAAQTPAPIVAVHVHVADSAGVPLPGAEVSVVRGLVTVLARGATDERGEQTLMVPRGGDEQLVVRKIGFTRVDRFFNDTGAVSFDIRLTRSVRSLDTVKVAAAEDVRRKSYFIDAEAIESSPRPIVDALDIVTKMRPDMIWGRQGRPDRIGQHVDMAGRRPRQAARSVVTAATKFGYCPPVQNVWVNGQRVRFVAVNPLAVERLAGDAVYISPLIATVLSSIKPEHVQEMEYHACTDVIADTPARSTNAIFVTLKPGIGFSPGIGSYVAARALALAEAQPDGAPLPQRLIGVFDEETGSVVADAQIVDVATGSFMRTSETGTATLAFLSSGASQIKIQKAGYDTLTLPVSRTPADTAPITVVLAKHRAPSPHL